MFYFALKTTFPVMTGYVTVGITFGLLASNMLIPWYYIILMSVFIYAGAGQFLALGLFAAHATLIEIALATFLLNLRHIFYGLSMLSSLKHIKKYKQYIIFGLTDETFALLKTTKVDNEHKGSVYFLITLLNQIYWVLGSILGIMGGSLIAINYEGIEFCLTSLFVVLSIEIYKNNPNLKLVFMTCIIATFGLIFIPTSKMLIFSLMSAVIASIILKGWLINE